MNRLTCEMCGSNEMVKQDGYFVCQFCGCKYTVEEAKKMMIEGTVDVTGSTVKVDNSEFVEKFLNNARRAYHKEDWEEVEKYYNMVEQNVPDNIEAVFFSAYGKAMLAMTDSEYFKRDQKFEVLKRSISVISDYYTTTKENKEEVLSKLAHAIKHMNAVSYVYNINISSGIGSKRWQIALLNVITATFAAELAEIYDAHKDSYLLDLMKMFETKPKSTFKGVPLILSLIGFYCALCGLFAFGVTSIASIVLGIIALPKASKVGKFKGLALCSIIAGVVTFILGIIICSSIYL